MDFQPCCGLDGPAGVSWSASWSSAQKPSNHNRLGYPLRIASLDIFRLFLFQSEKSTQSTFMCSEQWCSCRDALGPKGRFFLLHCNCQRVPFSVCAPCQLTLMPASWQLNEGPLVPLVSSQVTCRPHSVTIKETEGDSESLENGPLWSARGSTAPLGNDIRYK